MGPSCSTNIHTDSHFWPHVEPDKLIFMSKTQNQLFMINLISPSVHIGVGESVKNKSNHMAHLNF